MRFLPRVKSLKKTIYFLLFFLSIFLLPFCNSQKAAPRKLLQGKYCNEISRFVHEFFIDKKALYTLVGEKPVTSEILHQYDEEDLLTIQRFVEDHPDLEFIQIDRNIENDWPIWKDQIKSLNLKNFLFAEIHPSHLGEKEDLLIFLNIPTTLKCLKSYSEIFEEELGLHFSPHEVIENLKSGQLGFWNQVFDNQRLEGILLGFGAKNSELFQIACSKCKATSSDKSVSFPSPPPDSGKMVQNHTLFLPSFACMDRKESMEILKKYEFIRDQICSECQRQKIEEYVLERLSQF